jgi:uncharacterized protein YndB with AHSA1/START domain
VRVVLVVIAVIVALIVLALAIGASLPRRHKASRSVVLRRSPADVYALVRDPASAPSWRPEVKRVDLLGIVDGHERFREHGRHGAVTYEIVDDAASRLLVTRIVDRDLGYSGSWRYDFTPENGGTRVTITEDGDVSNLFFRFMSRFVFGHTATMDKTLEAMKRHFGE